MGSALGLLWAAFPPTLSLSSLSVRTSPSAGATPQSQGSPLLGHTCAAPLTLNHKPLNPKSARRPACLLSALRQSHLWHNATLRAHRSCESPGILG